MAEIPITQQKTGYSFNLPTVSPAMGGTKVLQAASDFVADTGNKISVQAEKNYLLRLEGQMRRDVANLERNMIADPDQLQTQLSQYRDSMLENLDRGYLRDQVDAQYQVYAQASITRSYEAKQRIMDEETQVSALFAIESIKGQALDNAPKLFSKDPRIAASAGLEAQSHMASIQGVLGMTNSKGEPIFSPEKRFTVLQSTRDDMYQNAANSWLREQPDKMRAYQAWLDGNVKITLPDENGNPLEVGIRDALPAETRQYVDKKLGDTLRDEVSLQNMIDTRNDRAFKKRSEAISADLKLRAMNGTVEVAEIDAQKSFLEPDTYLDLRKMAMTDDPVTDGREYARLLAKVSNGQDIADDLRMSRFEARKLSNQDFTELQRMSENRKGAAQEPVEAGREYLMSSLGRLSTELGFEQALAIGPAKIEYEQNIEQFVNQNGRRPTLTESRDLADGVIQRYSRIGAAASLSQAAKPQVIPRNEMKPTVLTQEGYIANKRKEAAVFYAKRNGFDLAKPEDVEKLKQSPDFLRELRDLDRLERIAAELRTEQEQKAAQKAAQGR